MNQKEEARAFIGNRKKNKKRSWFLQKGNLGSGLQLMAILLAPTCPAHSMNLKQPIGAKALYSSYTACRVYRKLGVLRGK